MTKLIGKAIIPVICMVAEEGGEPLFYTTNGMNFSWVP